MKKIILLALAALLIFTMVSCDGNADFLLWNEEEATEKKITLIICGEGSWYFDSAFNSSVEITVNANTWGDLLDDVALGHNLYDYGYTTTLENAKFDSTNIYQNDMTVMTVTADNLYRTMFICTSDSVNNDSYVKPTDEIVDGKTYYVVVTYGS